MVKRGMEKKKKSKKWRWGMESGSQNLEKFFQDLGRGCSEEEWARLGPPRPTKEKQVQRHWNWPRAGEGVVEGVKLSACTKGYYCKIIIWLLVMFFVMRFIIIFLAISVDKTRTFLYIKFLKNFKDKIHYEYILILPIQIKEKRVYLTFSILNMSFLPHQ